MRSRRPNRHAPTTASKRKRRRHARRDIRRGGEYFPMEVRANAAKRAASTRLWLATACASLTVTAVVAAVVSSQGAFALAALLILAFFSFNATVALVLSARREERVHGLVAADPVPAQLEFDGVDGSVDRVRIG